MHNTGYNLLSVFSDYSLNHLGFKWCEVAKDSAETMEDSDEKISAVTNIADAYAKEYNSDEPVTKKKAEEVNGTFECQVIVRISNLILAMTMDCWKKIED